MARSRNIKPGFFENEILAECKFETRLLFAGLWTIADREGRLIDSPKRIKIKIFPYDDINVNELLNELASKHDNDGTAAFILRYAVNNIEYIQIIHFNEHQNPHKKEILSTIPAPDLYSTSMVPESDLYSTNTVPASGLHSTSTVLTPGLHGTNTVLAPGLHGANGLQTQKKCGTVLAPDLHSTNIVLASDKHHASRADSLNPIIDSLNPHPLNRCPVQELDSVNDDVEVFKIYENEIGILSGMASEFLKDAINTYGKEWVLLAIKEAVKHSARNFSYIDAVLHNWKTNGINSKPAKKGQAVIPSKEKAWEEYREKLIDPKPPINWSDDFITRTATALDWKFEDTNNFKTKFFNEYEAIIKAAC